MKRVRWAWWAAALLCAGDALGQQQPTRYRFALSTFESSLPGDRFFSVRDAGVRLKGSPGDERLGGALSKGLAGAALTLDLSRDLLSVRGTLSGQRSPVIQGREVLHIDLMAARWRRAALAVGVPVRLHQAAPGGALVGLEGGRPLGDLRLSLRGQLAGQAQSPAALAAQLDVRLPTGSPGALDGDGATRLHPHLALSGKAGSLIYAANAGLLLRERQSFEVTAIGNALSFGAALGYRVALADPTQRLNQLQLSAELFGNTLVSGQQGDPAPFRGVATPAELLLGLRMIEETPGNNLLALGLAGGPGLSAAPGAPGYRLLASLALAAGDDRLPADTDRDRIEDALDACPDRPGIASVDPGLHGCPIPPDRDRDQIIDDDDACPDQPGPRSSVRAKNGCPLPPDRDRDQITDSDDACPADPGPASADPTKNGCPIPPDRDRDEVPDGLDACPDQQGQRSDDARASGCPDGDGDGVVDPLDACPKLPGKASPEPDKNGCPLARVEASQISITQNVLFETARATILQDSAELLRAVADVLRQHPEITLVRIEGHTDNEGDRARNLRLSRQRAEAVKAWLVGREKIDARRLETSGLGDERPVAPNETEAGRARNRRVVFVITRR